MQSLGANVGSLSRMRRAWARGALGPWPQADAETVASRLTAVAAFGSNPGNLRMLEYVPATVKPGPALVVVLHGCTQTAAAYDLGTGWSTLADEEGFVVLFAEQPRANNAKMCFNWFEPGDTRRGAGEALSIRQMIDHAVAAHGIDRGRIFVTGLSAGGAMTAVMLATYPEVFAGGAIVAGLPYGAAAGVRDALHAMFHGRSRPARDWGDEVRRASSHRGPWPRVSVWHGEADATVKPTNADEIVKQWSDIHGISGRPALESKESGFVRRAWTDDAGREVIESFTVGGMAHGVPLAAGEGDGRYGAAGPFLLDVGVSSTDRIARFWGLLGSARASAEDEARRTEAQEELLSLATRLRLNGRKAPDDAAPQEQHRPAGLPVDIGGVIRKALRAAGLMR